MKRFGLLFLSCLALAEGDPRGRLLKGPGGVQAYAPVLVDIQDQEGSRNRTKSAPLADKPVKLEPNRVYLYYYGPMKTWYQVLTRPDGTLPSKPLEFLRWATVLKGTQLGAKSSDLKYVLHNDGTWKITSKGEYQAYWQIQKPPRIRFVEYRTSTDFTANAEKKGQRKTVSAGEGASALLHSFALGPTEKEAEPPRILDLSSMSVQLRKTGNLSIPNRVYAVWHRDKKVWAYTLSDAYGKWSEPLEILAPQTVLPGGYIGAPDPFGRYRMEKNGAWSKTTDPEVIFSSFAEDPTRLKRVSYFTPPPDKKSPFLVD